MFNKLKSVGIILLISVSLSGCLSKGKESRINQDSDSSEPVPDYILQDVTHYYYENGIKKSTIMFESGEYYSEREELYIENCNYIYYNKDGTISSRGSSDRAKIFNNGSLIISEDNVVVISETNNAVLETEYLEWHGDEEQFITDRFVTITRTNGDIITGYGMLTDLSIRFVTINKDAKGSFAEDQD